MSGRRDEEKPSDGKDGEMHKVDEKVQEEAAEELEEDPGYT